MSTPNDTLRAVRMGLRMSQDDLARALREAGDRVGIPNEASKRLVQRWESGAITTPRPVYARALEAITGLPVERLGFSAVPDGTGGHDVTTPGADAPAAMPAPLPGNYSGIWLSRYVYHSSGRDETLTSEHYVIVLQHGNRLTVRSLPESAGSSMAMDLTVDGNIVTGTWTEQTDPAGYYRGATYHGAIQMLAEPSGRRMTGKWVGFGSSMDVNTGPWELVFQDPSTTKTAIDKYRQKPTG